MRSGFFLLALSLVIYYAAFQLPFRFPPQRRLWSLSYIFGFNNQVAIFAMAALLGVVTLLYLLRRSRQCGCHIAFACEGYRRGSRSLVVALLVAGLSYTGLTFVAYVYNEQSAPWLMWETRHHLHRLWLMDLYGLRPYSEISAEYGPVLVYGPLGVYGLLKSFGISHEQAYFVCYLLLNVAGLWCIYYVLSRAKMAPRAKLAAFGVLAVAGFTPYMGISGVLVRYLFPFVTLFLGNRIVEWAFRQRNHIRYGICAIVISLLLGANILLSSEVGVAFALAWLGYALLTVRYRLQVLAISLVALVIGAVICWLLLPGPYYSTLWHFSAGANNLPLLPAPHILLYLLTMFLLVPQLLADGARGWIAGDRSNLVICGSLGVLCVAMMPGALGRCDPPHVLFYGMGASMLLMIRLASVSRLAFTTYVGAYAAVFVVLIQLINLKVFYGISPQVFFSPNAVAVLAQKLRKGSGTDHPNIVTLSALDRYSRLGLPFASFGDPAVERYALVRGKVEPEYYISTVGVYDSAAVERKLRDVGNAEYLLVPENFSRFAAFTSSQPSNRCAGYLKSLREWFLYPATLSCRTEPIDPLSSLQSFIVDNYVAVEHIGSWLVLRRASAAPSNVR
jgi:hypothetical protein